MYKYYISKNKCMDMNILTNYEWRFVNYIWRTDSNKHVFWSIF